MAYSMVDVSGMSGVSLNELSQYAETGLLNPAFGDVEEDIYYEKQELLRLQQILFCKEVGMKENEIGPMLRDHPQDVIRIMKQHRIDMLEKALRLHGLIQTLDKTISHLQGEQELDEHELYIGFVNKGRHQLLNESGSDPVVTNDMNHVQTEGTQRSDIQSSNTSTLPENQELKSKKIIWIPRRELTRFIWTCNRPLRMDWNPVVQKYNGLLAGILNGSKVIIHPPLRSIGIWPICM